MTTKARIRFSDLTIEQLEERLPDVIKFVLTCETCKRRLIRTADTKSWQGNWLCELSHTRLISEHSMMERIKAVVRMYNEHQNKKKGQLNFAKIWRMVCRITVLKFQRAEEYVKSRA